MGSETTDESTDDDLRSDYPSEDPAPSGSSGTTGPSGSASMASAASRALRARRAAAGATDATADTADVVDEPDDAVADRGVDAVDSSTDDTADNPTYDTVEDIAEEPTASGGPDDAPVGAVAAAAVAAEPTVSLRKTEKPGAKPSAKPAPKAATKRAVTEPAEDRRSRGPFGRTAVLAYGAVAGLMVAAAVITGVLAARTTPNSDLRFADARDAVVVDATKDIQTLNALDYRSAEAGLSAWLAVSTGTLHDEIVAQRQAVLTEVQQKKTVTSASVLAAAVSTLDDRAGSATVLASVEQTVTPAGQAAAKKRDRFAVDMTKVGSAWKINSITLVPV